MDKKSLGGMGLCPVCGGEGRISKSRVCTACHGTGFQKSDEICPHCYANLGSGEPHSGRCPLNPHHPINQKDEFMK